jgi:hypothetical protein
LKASTFRTKLDDVKAAIKSFIERQCRDNPACKAHCSALLEHAETIKNLITEEDDSTPGAGFQFVMGNDPTNPALGKNS